MFKYTLLLLATLIIGSQLTRADDMPQKPEAIKKLSFLTGKWKGKGSMTYKGEKYEITSITNTFKPLFDGWGFTFDESMDIKGWPKYMAHSVWGYDEGTKMHHLYTVDNVGSVHDHAGKFTTDKKLQLVHRGTVDGKSYVETIDVEFTSEKEFNLHVTAKLGKDVIEDFTATLKKM